ncbi:unnamed protein product [Pleuronectes platessa]|uniref:Uncharacterized protein n=1 Tax=Pleuronectes platessa TaxID=8262 RepID=A0A9N7VYQ5_PLEPL|nr:unnamed protein product [Pleuronectes platessa]
MPRRLSLSDLSVAELAFSGDSSCWSSMDDEQEPANRSLWNNSGYLSSRRPQVSEPVSDCVSAWCRRPSCG